MSSKLQNQPVAIVGIGCRLPGGASDVKKFWDLLLNKVDAVRTVPEDRWDVRRFYNPEEELRQDKISTTQGGFLVEPVDTFDPDFFEVSPREAKVLDPQQRLLMEVSYEAIEDAGFSLSKLSGSNTGVFVGGFTLDYTMLQLDRESRHLLNSSGATGSLHTMLSNKLSYLYNLKGPSLTIDTACSSSLVATHYACREIWSGECDMALVGGVNMMLIPTLSILMSSGKFLSRDGRCRTFDKDGSGYVRGEGAAVVILKRLDHAERDGDKIYALIRSTGLNQDGKTNGITTPSYESQKGLISKVYDAVDIDINRLHYIEAHGTGTPAGDPIEFRSLNNVLVEKGYKADKCLVGSVKSNIGHLEAGAGVVGLIKAALCLKNKTAPPNLHFNTPNPNLKYEHSKLRVPVEAEALPADVTSLAAVNSFGYGGTNAHVLLEEFVAKPQPAPAPEKEVKKEGGYFVFPISANSPEALKSLAGSYAAYLEETENDFDDVLFSTIFRRSHLRNRLTAAASSAEELISQLKNYAAGNPVKGVVVNEKMPEVLRPVFVFTGMGPQWWKMGRELYEAEPLFKKALHECDEIFKKISGWSVLEEMMKDEADSRMKDTCIAQPANFYIQYGLTRMLEKYGVAADAYIGHSVGEVASTYFSGALSLEQALEVSHIRSLLQSRMAGTGAMLAVSLTEPEAAQYLDMYDDISIAAINSPGSLTLAGNEDSLSAVSEDLNLKGVFNRVLEVEVPYHSPLMDPIRDELLERLSILTPRATHTDLYSTVTGSKIEGTEINNNYWWKNVRNAVNFAGAIQELSDNGYKLFIEIGPHPVLKNSITECLAKADRKGILLHFMNRKEPEQQQFYSQLGCLFTLGYPLQLNSLSPDGKMVDLPKYSWNRSVFWNEGKNHRQDRIGYKGNVFTYYRTPTYHPSYEVELNVNFFPFIKDHMVQGKIIFPGAGYIAAAIALAQSDVVAENQIVTLEDITFHQLMFFDSRRSHFINTSYFPKNGQFQVLSRVEDENSTQWQMRATGRIAQNGMAPLNSSIDIERIKASCTTDIGPDDFYAKLSRMKLDYGHFFRGVQSLRTGHNEVLAEIAAPEGLDENPYFIHPALLDACFQALVATAPEIEIVPVGIHRIHCIKPVGKKFWCYGKGTSVSADSLSADMWICDEEGNICMLLEGFYCRELVLENKQEAKTMQELFYYPSWEKLPAVAAGDTLDKVFYVYSSDAEKSEAVVNQLEKQGHGYRISPSFSGANGTSLHIGDSAGIQQLKEHFSSQQKNIHLIYIADSLSAEAGDVVSSSDCYNQLHPLITLASALNAANEKAELSLDIITEQTRLVLETDTCSNMASFALSGFGHLISNEYARIYVRHFDLDGRTASADALFNADKGTFAEFISRSWGETDMALRGNEMYAKRMHRKENNRAEAKPVTVNTSSTMLDLSFSSGGGIKTLTFKDAEKKAPAAGEIEVMVSDVSINFKDYLKVAGLISKKAIENTFFDETIGMDCAGVVTRTGEGVETFKPGDRVFCCAGDGAFKTFVTVKEGMAWFEPATLRNHYSSHTPIVFFTALSALRDIANLKKGEKVLIHNAAGGVGLAAIQYANYAGAEVYATTSRPEKAAFLKAMGVKHVYNVKNLEFVSGITNDTDGYGVDVVLSALPGEVMYQSLALLASYGRYVEIGKKDIIDNAGLPLQFFSKNLSFSSLDVDKILNEQPARVKALFKDVFTHFENGDFKPLEVSVFPATQIREAFELVEKGQHIGKVVIDMENKDIEIMRTENGAASLKGATCLITGGTQGLGLQLAKWLADKGIGCVVLASRSGLSDSIRDEVMNYFEEKNVMVRIEKMDVSSFEQVNAVAASIAAELPPLKMVIHSAMVLDDGLLEDLTEQRFMKVMRPKIDGAINLHRALLEKTKPDYFICISSISSLIGNPGQGNYVAANGFMDAFTFYRKSLGLPCTTLNLGVLLETGVVQRDKNLQIILESAGIRGFSNQDVINGFETILSHPAEQAGFFDIDWARWSASNKKLSGISFFRKYIEEGRMNQGSNKEQMDFVRQIMEMDAKEKHAFVVSTLRTILSEILKMPEENVNPEKGINLLGIDSVMVVELISAILKKFGVSMNPMDFLSGPTINDVAVSVLAKLNL
jgi:acyl transferase domain-containing protein/NADPH:quinone reductase-like Zn-dependent oxidoreductase/NADP-dependent 3-hydroxy acid dehydrogenase YdfG/acyl carrier protein